MELRKGADISYPDIKKAGSTQSHHYNGRANIATSTIIKSKEIIKRKRNK